MNPLAFLFRIALGVALFVIFVVIWAWSPYLTGEYAEKGFASGLLSIFFGTQTPGKWTVVALLWSRAFVGFALISWFTTPALQFFMDASFRGLARAGVIVFSSLATACFMAVLLIEYLYYKGGWATFF